MSKIPGQPNYFSFLKKSRQKVFFFFFFFCTPCQKSGQALPLCYVTSGHFLKACKKISSGKRGEKCRSLNVE